MHLAKGWLARLRRHFPHGGYQLALLFGGMLLVTPLHIRLGTLFVLVSALAAASHLLAPRERRGGWPYWALTYAWLAAAALGLLAEWRALDPLTPWLSLARYLLCGSAMLGVAVSTVRGEPLFVRVEGLRFASLVRILFGVVQVAFVVFWLYLLAPDWTLRLALAPRHPEARISMLFPMSGEENTDLCAMSLSPDAKHVLLADADGVWAVAADAPSAPARRVPGLFYMDNPWLPSRKAFYLSREEEPRSHSLWLADASGSRVEKIADDAARGTCSPTGEWIAYANQEGVWLANPDGSAPRILFPDGTSARWSPDGQRLLCTVRRRLLQRQDYYVVQVDGEIRRLDIPVDHMSIMWLGPTRLLSISDGKRGILTGTRLLPESRAHIWTLDGREERAFGLGVNCIAQVSPSPDGARLAFGASLPPLFDLFRSMRRSAADAPAITHNLFLMDLATGRVTRLPTPGSVVAVAWSADGTTLLVHGMYASRDGDGSEAVIRGAFALISGL